MPPTLLGTSNGSFSAPSANFLTSNTAFFRIFCDLSDEVSQNKNHQISIEINIKISRNFQIFFQNFQEFFFRIFCDFFSEFFKTFFFRIFQTFFFQNFSNFFRRIWELTFFGVSEVWVEAQDLWTPQILISHNLQVFFFFKISLSPFFCFGRVVQRAPPTAKRYQVTVAILAQGKPSG